MPFTKPNHLADPIQRMAAAKLNLPKKLIEHFTECERLTELFRLELTGMLSDELLSACRVTDYDRTSLYLSVPTQTLANHLAYQSDYMLTKLRVNPAFGHLQSLHLLVSNDPKTL